MGIVFLALAAVVLFAWAIPAGTLPAWVVFGMLLAGAAMGIGQGWAGICVVRAMGFKTNM